MNTQPRRNTMKTPIITAALTAVVLVAPATTNAQETEGCTTVDYQGVPLEMCPPQEPDPTNCYTGDYQGAPIEICMPTGWEPDPSWTYQGEPIAMYDSTEGVGVTDTGDTVAVAQPPAPAPAPPVDVSWVADYVALLG